MSTLEAAKMVHLADVLSLERKRRQREDQRIKQERLDLRADFLEELKGLIRHYESFGLEISGKIIVDDRHVEIKE